MSYLFPFPVCAICCSSRSSWFNRVKETAVMWDKAPRQQRFRLRWCDVVYVLRYSSLKKDKWCNLAPASAQHHWRTLLPVFAWFLFCSRAQHPGRVCFQLCAAGGTLMSPLHFDSFELGLLRAWWSTAHCCSCCSSEHLGSIDSLLLQPARSANFGGVAGEGHSKMKSCRRQLDFLQSRKLQKLSLGSFYRLHFVCMKTNIWDILIELHSI